MPGFLPSLDYDNELIKTTKRGDFPFLTYLNRELINIRNKMNIDNFNDTDDCLLAMAVIHNFAYLNSLASVHGFTAYDELIYPFTNQCIITNGQNWSFFVYQMNTHAFHTDLYTENADQSPKKQNLCWSLNNVKLYDSYENGRFVNVNDEVIRNLIKMYIQKPRSISEEECKSELRPFLSADLRSQEEKIKLRENLLRRFAGFKTQREHALILGRKVYPFEWLYMRNPNSHKKFLRTLKKPRDIWPLDKLQPAVNKFSNHK